MGSYYSGVMNSDYDSELKHFGILGQKWGIRRFQNPDGTLTPAGRERYGYSNLSEKERKNLLSMIHRSPRDIEKIKNHPTINSAAQELKEYAYPIAESLYKNERLEEDVFHQVYDNRDNYEKWLDKAVDEYMKTYGKDSGGNKEEIKNWYKYDDGDQGEYGLIETYIRESKEPLAKKYIENQKQYGKLLSDLRSKTDKIAEKILGEDADKMDKFWVSYFIGEAVRKYGPMQPSRD